MAASELVRTLASPVWTSHTIVALRAVVLTTKGPPIIFWSAAEIDTPANRSARHVFMIPFMIIAKPEDENPRRLHGPSRGIRECADDPMLQYRQRDQSRSRGPRTGPPPCPRPAALDEDRE